jgi:hypothetical protein
MISILFLKIGLTKNCRKTILKKSSQEACTGVSYCFPNILDTVVLENINLPEDKIG